MGPVESVDGREETFKPEISHEFDDQNGDNVEENVSEEKIEEVPILEKSKTRVLCFVNDSSRLRSLVVPCHFVSRYVIDRNEFIVNYFCLRINYKLFPQCWHSVIIIFTFKSISQN